jgi:hypothetical protein
MRQFRGVLDSTSQPGIRHIGIVPLRRDCFVSLAMTARWVCHCEERSEEAISPGELTEIGR